MLSLQFHSSGCYTRDTRVIMAVTLSGAILSRLQLNVSTGDPVYEQRCSWIKGQYWPRTIVLVPNAKGRKHFLLFPSLQSLTFALCRSVIRWSDGMCFWESSQKWILFLFWCPLLCSWFIASKVLSQSNDTSYKNKQIFRAW